MYAGLEWFWQYNANIYMYIYIYYTYDRSIVFIIPVDPSTILGSFWGMILLGYFVPSREVFFLDP